MRRIPLFLCLFLLCAAALQAQSCAIAESALAEASRLRGLSIKRRVPCILEAKEQVKKFMLETIETKLPPKRLQHEERVFQTIGIVPDDFAYEQGLVDLYVSQIGGYYDPGRKRYTMAAWLPDMMQPTIAAHELTHALQDQHFDLESMTDFKKFNGDELLARSALIEGDATAVMYDYSRVQAGLPGIKAEPNVNSILMQNALGASMMSGLANMPQSLQLIMIFPYSSGLRFVHQFLKKNGYRAVDNLLRRPPGSTEEILHPEKYPAATNEYVKIEPGALRLKEIPAGYESVYEDVIGEFVLSVLIGQQLGDNARASRVASGWGGDRLALFEKVGSKDSYLVWRLHWDSVKDLHEFTDAWLAVLKKRFSLTAANCADGVPFKAKGSGDRMYQLGCSVDGADVTLTFHVG